MPHPHDPCPLDTDYEDCDLIFGALLSTIEDLRRRGSPDEAMLHKLDLLTDRVRKTRETTWDIQADAEMVDGDSAHEEMRADWNREDAA